MSGGHHIIQTSLPIMTFKTFPMLVRFYFANGKIAGGLILSPRKTNKSELYPSLLSLLIAVVLYILTVICWCCFPCLCALSVVGRYPCYNTYSILIFYVFFALPIIYNIYNIHNINSCLLRIHCA